MKRSLSFLGVAVAVGAVALVTGACQTYDFEPVDPLAVAQVTERRTVISQASKANIMLVVDQSGSMLEPINRSHSACTSTCGPSEPCPANCPTRITEMKSAMGDFLTQFGTTARYGLSVFPQSVIGGQAPDVCGAGSTWKVVSESNDIDAELQEHSDQIATLIQGIIPGGGTPVASTLQVLANNPGLNADDGRQDFVLLLTDGLPNCNTGLDTATCTCVAINSSTGQPFSPCYGPGGASDSRNCMDESRVVQTISVLRNKNIKTIVVAFGAEVGNELALGPLNAMAEAGGFGRRCATADDCGMGQTCDGATADTQGVCSVKFYKAANSTELAVALDEIRKQIPTEDPCKYRLQAKPESDRFIVVYMDGQRYTSGAETWSYAQEDGDAVVTLNGPLCTKVLNATPTAPVEVEVKIVESL